MLFTMLNFKFYTEPKNNFNNIPFVTSFHEDKDNKIIMKNIKRKIENTPSDYIKEIFQESNTSYHVNLKIYYDCFLILPSPEIQVYLKEFLNAMIKDVKYSGSTS